MSSYNHFDSSSSSSSSSSSEDGGIKAIYRGAAIAANVYKRQQKKKRTRRGGYAQSRRYVHRDRIGAEKFLKRDYFDEGCTYFDETFRRRFRMKKSLFMRIQDAVLEHDQVNFEQRPDAVKKMGLSSLQKVTAAIRILAYGMAADQCDEYLKVGESTALKSMKEFCIAVIEIIAGLGPILKGLNTNSREKACETLLARLCRQAPTLLDYKPSYKGVLRGRRKKTEGESSKAAKRDQPSGTVVRKKKKANLNIEGVREKRERGVRLPKIGYTAEEWLTPLGADEIPVPLKIVEPATKEMSRRNILRPVIPTKFANPTRTRGSSEDQQQQKEKRQKTKADDLQSGSVQQPPAEKVRASSPKDMGVDLHPEPHIDLTDLDTESAILWQFSPSYTMPDGRVLLLKDSVKEEPNLAAGQAALKAYDKAAKVSAECERYRSDRDSFCTKWRISEQEVKDKEAEVKSLKKELADARAVAELASSELKVVKAGEKEKMREADAKGYETGIKRATLEYTQVAHRMVNDELEVWLPDFFKLGYAAGADAMAGVMAIQPESGFLKQLPELIVPSLDLPYTEEECQPLPPEEDDEEMVDVPHAKPQSNVEGGTRRVATDDQVVD
ncbi:hypothetical protein RHSIM_Rhsim12G0055300 [Rhododendron simsii]|uniref:Uncharacterized protein n=1 Tax=Rhododendron simsii TaxID=118357 RepID=A0A834G6A1_RHOSS|nr:hypothetical protein RHSIM_Rhsim12G0055300 [Rhododendron simsii]